MEVEGGGCARCPHRQASLVIVRALSLLWLLFGHMTVRERATPSRDTPNSDKSHLPGNFDSCIHSHLQCCGIWKPRLGVQAVLAWTVRSLVLLP
jgi:hypothetical protein